jgi:hypothetical protein
MYDHSRTYREAQLGFLEVLQQADGNKLYNILQGHPYHVDTLMQLSEMMVQQGDLGASLLPPYRPRLTTITHRRILKSSL